LAQRQACVAAANAAPADGKSEQDAIFACIGAMKSVAKDEVRIKKADVELHTGSRRARLTTRPSLTGLRPYWVTGNEALGMSAPGRPSEANRTPQARRGGTPECRTLFTVLSSGFSGAPWITRCGLQSRTGPRIGQNPCLSGQQQSN
jgi:hypothetical protein